MPSPVSHYRPTPLALKAPARETSLNLWEARTTTLQNGLTVYQANIPHTNSFSVHAVVRAGSNNDPRRKSGMAHLVEHLIGELQSDGLTDEQMKQILHPRGIERNAETGDRQTSYFATGPSSHHELIIQSVARPLIKPPIMQSSLSRQVKIITQEIADNYGQSQEMFSEVIARRFFLKGTEADRSVLGSRGSLARISLDDVVSFVNTYYTTGSMAVIVAGKLPHPEILNPILEREFTHLNCSPAVSSAFRQPSELARKKQILVKQDKNAPSISIALQFPGIHHTDPDYHIARFLSDALFTSCISPLMLKAREQNHENYAVNAYDASYNSTACFMIEFSADCSKVAASVIKTALGIIKEVLESPFDSDLLRDELSHRREKLALKDTTTENLCESLANGYVKTGKFLSPSEILELEDTITAESAQRVARRIFDMDKLKIAAVGNIKPEKLRQFVRGE